MRIMKALEIFVTLLKMEDKRRDEWKQKYQNVGMNCIIRGINTTSPVTIYHIIIVFIAPGFQVSVVFVEHLLESFGFVLLFQL